MSILSALKKPLTVVLAASAMVMAAAAVPVTDTGSQSVGVISAQAATVSVPKVTGVKTQTLGTSSVKVTWTKQSNATGYQVFQQRNGVYSLLKSIYSNTNTYTITNLPAARITNVKVRAWRTVGGKNYFGALSDPCWTATNPAKVTGIKAAPASNSVKFTWNAVTCDYYRIYQMQSNGKWKGIKNVTTNSGTITGLNANTAYKFCIRAWRTDWAKADHGSALSDTVSTKTTKAATPVAANGRLSVKGANIVNSAGKVFKIKGMSTHGIMWEDFRNILSVASLKVLRDDWKCNTIRVAMYTEEWGGYTTGSSYASTAKARVKAAVENAKNVGMYVIIDWHILSDGDPRKHQSEAVAFFKEMANTYKNYNNVIYEICNEPNGGVSWNGGIKSYCQSVVNAIRTYDKNAVIVCGTGTWSQDIDQVVGNRLSDKNCVYALHFYANTHTDWLRNRLQTCYNKGLPVLVSEFGTCDASGNGGFNKSQTQTWLKLLDSLNVGYINWSASNKNETASAFKPGTNLRAISSGTSQLTDSGKLVREWYRAH